MAATIESMAAAIRESVEKDAPYLIEYRIVRKDGEVRWIHTSGKVLRIKERGFTDKSGKRGDQLVTLQIELDEPALPEDHVVFSPKTVLASYAEQSRTTFRDSGSPTTRYWYGPDIDRCTASTRLRPRARCTWTKALGNLNGWLSGSATVPPAPANGTEVPGAT